MSKVSGAVDSLPSLRTTMVAIALQWQRRYGVAPQITAALSEYDASRLVGMPDAEYSEYMQDKTAVSKGVDFEWRGTKYQVKANRPSGKPGSRVTLVPKAANYEWDWLVWILYNTEYEIQEAWKWSRDAYISAFDAKKRLSPNDYRRGEELEIRQ